MNQTRWLGGSGWVVLCLVSVLFVSTAQAQEFATLEGTVTDATGAVIPDAEVVAISTATGTSRTVLTGSEGAFVLAQMHPGSYTVRVSRQGFRTAVREDVLLLVATPTTLDFTLEVGAVAEQVVVEAPVAPTINTTDASVGNVFSELQVKEVPAVARNPLGLLTLQPGVVVSGGSDLDNLFMGTTQGLDERDGVVNGVRANQSNVTLDGVDVNDIETQAAFTSVLPVSLDSLQEFRVTTSNATATEGTAGGAQVALVTKSGTNDWHGNARWFHRNDATSANDFFNNSAGIGVPKLIRNIFGASGGGPIRPDRAFFFADWESRRDSSEANVSRIVPSETAKMGLLRYACDPGDPLSATLCPDGTFTLSSAQVQAVDPAGLGVNPAMLSYLSQFPTGNDPTQGLDVGLNFTGFRFNAPIEITNNIYTTRFDFNLDSEGKHTVFWRGSLADIKTDLIPAHFPGRPPSAILLNNGKGFSASYTAQLQPTLINTFRYGFTRGGIKQTGVDGPEFSVRSLDANTNFNRGFGNKRPINEFKDDLTWVRGTHTIQAGINYRRLRNDRFTGVISFPDYLINNGFCLDLCRTAFDSVVNDPTLPDPISDNEFTRAYMMLVGTITQVESSFLVDPQSQSFLPAGTLQEREFAENDFEWYIQDSWRLRPNLTLIVGLRHSYFGPVWETGGAMVAPTMDIGEFLFNRQVGFENGVPSDRQPLFQFDLAGKANGRDGWWDPDKDNWAPRISLAWSPGFDEGVGRALFGGPGKSSVRAGFGLFYGRVGGAIAVATDQFGSPGLSNSLINAASQFSLATAPRFSGTCDASGCTGLPPLASFLAIPSAATFPFSPAENASGVGFIVDNDLQTPYSMNLAFSIQRELPGQITLDLGYVGVLGRKLLSNIDFGMIGGNLTDSASGQTLWGGYQNIVAQLGPDIFNPQADIFGAVFSADPALLAGIAEVPFFTNMMPNLPALAATEASFDFFGWCDTSGGGVDPACVSFIGNMTPTQVMYLYAATFAPTWVDPLFFDFDVFPLVSPWRADLDPQGDGFVMVQPQFQALSGFTNWGSSAYHSFQLGVRRNVGRVLFGANYVLAKSLDNGSAPENATLFGEDDQFSGFIPNTFDSKGNRARSDFDIRHNFNANWVIQLPFGQGQPVASDATGALEHLVGGWDILGAWRWHSGFPLSVNADFAFATSFFIAPPVDLAGNGSTNINRSGSGGPNIFQDPDAARLAFRHTPPGGNGSRNSITGPAFFQVDLGIGKTFRIGERARVRFRWEMFNVFNNVNFDDGDGILGVPNIETAFDTSPFGRIFATKPPREMQFTLRFDF